MVSYFDVLGELMVCEALNEKFLCLGVGRTYLGNELLQISSSLSALGSVVSIPTSNSLLARLRSTTCLRADSRKQSAPSPPVHSDVCA